MKKLVALKNLTYGTRRLVAGETFDAKNHFARVLTAIGRAREAEQRPVGQISPPPPAVKAKIEAILDKPAAPVVHPLDHDRDGVPGGSLPTEQRGLDELRAEAESLGVKIDRRWGEPRLRMAIAAARAE